MAGSISYIKIGNGDMTMIRNVRCIFIIMILLFIPALTGKDVRADDFQITDSALTAYYGSGGDIVIPDNVVHIADSVFLNNPDITSVQIPEGCLYISDGAFDGCVNLTYVSLPDSLIEIGNLAFARCTNLESCYLPQNIERIGSGAFRECRALKILEIPVETMVIEEGAFCYCDGIEQFAVRSGNTHYTAREGVLFSADMKQLIQYPCGRNEGTYAVPEGVEIIGRNAFTHALSLREVALPHTLRELMPFAFSSCTSITEIRLPGSLSHVSENAFKNAVNLCRVYAGNDRMKIEPDSFAGDSSVIMIGNKGSEIENYAKKYNIGFSERKETDIVYIPPTKELLF